MKSLSASLRSLTLPSGATSGGRIVLNGVSGSIEIYNEDGILVGEFSPSGLTFYSREFIGSRIFQYDPSSNVQTIYVDDGTETPSIILDGRPDTQGIWFSLVNDYLRLTRESDDNIPDILYGTVTSTVLELTGASLACASSDDLALDITGDLDIRFELQTDDWDPAGQSRVIASKYIYGGEKAWLLQLDHTTGALRFYWWERENSTPFGGQPSSVNMPSPPGGQQAVRVTLDVNNGAGASEYKYYTASTIAGPWTQLGITRTDLVSSIFSTTEPVRIGEAQGQATALPWVGQVIKAEFRSGIAGTLVANPDFTLQPIGALSFTDGSGVDWSINGGAQITSTGGDERSYPRGLVGEGSSTVDVTLSTTVGVYSDIVQTAAAVPVISGRKYRITFSGGFGIAFTGSGFAISDTVEFDLQRRFSGVWASIGATPRVRGNISTSSSRWPTPQIILPYAPAVDASLDFKVRAQRVAGAATVNIAIDTNSGNSPFRILVEDMGT
jgi:hypothetical protein